MLIQLLPTIIFKALAIILYLLQFRRYKIYKVLVVSHRTLGVSYASGINPNKKI
jgi:hypothetical protein